MYILNLNYNLMIEFNIPLKKDQIFSMYSSNRSSNELNEETEITLLDEIESILDESIYHIVDEKNIINISIILINYQGLLNDSKQKIISTIISNFILFINEFKDNFKNDNFKNRNTLKIYIFFIDWIIDCYLENSKIQNILPKKTRRNKENSKKANFNDEGDIIGSKQSIKKEIKQNISKIDNDIFISFENLLISLLKLVKLDFISVFEAKLIDEEFSNLLLKIGFDLLELNSYKLKIIKTNSSNFRQKTFDYLQILVNSENKNKSCLDLKVITKIVKLLYDEESFVNSLTDFVISSLNKENSFLNNIGYRIIQDIVDTINKENNFESQGLKNVTKFLITLSEKNTKVIYSNLSTLITFYDSEFYIVRNTLSELIVNIIINILCKYDNIDEETKENYLKIKENFLTILFERIYDKSSYCRSKTLQLFLRLIDYNTLKVNDFIHLLYESSIRIKDEKSNVRRAALILSVKIIETYPLLFRQNLYLTFDEVDKIINETQEDILKLKEDFENEENENKIKSQMEILKCFEDYKKVLNIIKTIINLSIILLSSKSITDVQESIYLLIRLKKLRLSYADHGIRNILSLIVKPEEKIVNFVVEAYKEIYFYEDLDIKHQSSNLIKLTVNLESSELICLKVLLKKMIDLKYLNQNIFKEIWITFLKNPEEDILKYNLNEHSIEYKNQLKCIYDEIRVSLQLLNLMSEFYESILSNNGSLLLKQIKILSLRSPIDWIIVKESLKATKTIYEKNKEIGESCIIHLTKLIITNYGTNNMLYYQCLTELLNTIFTVSKNPEIYSKYLLTKFSKPLFINSNNKKDISNNFLSQNIFNPSQINHARGLFEDNSNLKNNTDYENESEEEYELTSHKLSQLIFVVGHTALNMSIFCEKLESDLKRRIETKDEKKIQKLKSNDDELELIGGGKEAEMEYYVSKVQEIVNNDLLFSGMFGKFSHLIISLSRELFKKFESTASNEILNEDKILFKSVLLSLTKMMCITKNFCLDHLDFLFSILNSHMIDQSLKLNIISAFGDFINRFTNEMQCYIKKFLLK